MKKILSERGLAFFLVFIAFLISAYLYKQGKISFLPKKIDTSMIQNIVADIPFEEKELKLSYKNKPASLVVNIANFEDSEKWKEDGEFDYSSYYEGQSSLFLSSQGHSRSKATLELSQGFSLNDIVNVKLFIYVRSDVANIEELNLIFADQDSRELFKYPITGLDPNWNFLVLPKDKFVTLIGSENVEEVQNQPELRGREIRKVIFEIVSRPRTTASINLDYIWAEKTEDYLSDWNANNKKMISLGKDADRVSLLVVGLGGSTADLKAIGSAKNYTFKARFTPLNSGSFGFFLRNDYKSGFGYYLIMDGVERDSWQIYKNGVFDQKQQSIVMVKGSITNFKMEKGRPYWLKAELKDDHLSFYLSLNDKDYAKVGETDDYSFVSGGVGIYSGGSMFLVDDLQFFQ